MVKQVLTTPKLRSGLQQLVFYLQHNDNHYSRLNNYFYDELSHNLRLIDNTTPYGIGLCLRILKISPNLGRHLSLGFIECASVDSKSFECTNNQIRVNQIFIKSIEVYRSKQNFKFSQNTIELDH